MQGNDACVLSPPPLRSGQSSRGTGAAETQTGRVEPLDGRGFSALGGVGARGGSAGSGDFGDFRTGFHAATSQA